MKKIWWILIYLIVSGGVLFATFHDAGIYKVPVGRIISTKTVHRHHEVDTFNNHDTVTRQQLKVKILNGKHKGEIVSVQNDYSNSQAMDVKYRPKQSVILHFDMHHKKLKRVTIKDTKRDGYVVFLMLVVIGLLLLMKQTGIQAGISLILNGALFLLAVELDVKLDGVGVLGIFAGVAVIFCAMTLSLVLGLNRKMLATVITTLLGTFVAVMLAVVVLKLTNNGGLHYENVEYVTQNPMPLFLAQTILGSLGAVMDEATDIIVSLAKILKENPTITMKNLWQSGKNIGKTIMGPLLNVLFMIFMADTFSMMILYLRNGNGFGYSFLMNMQLGFVQSLISGIGIVVTIPIACLVAAKLFKRPVKINE